jgi:phospholipase/lecithinase/hemolysin
MNLTGLTDTLINDPLGPDGMYDLTNVTDPACPGCNFAGLDPGPIVDNPDEFLYWDQTHFTAAVHQIIGDFAADIVEAFPYSPLGSSSAVPEPSALLLTICTIVACIVYRRCGPR